MSFLPLHFKSYLPSIQSATGNLLPETKESRQEKLQEDQSHKHLVKNPAGHNATLEICKRPRDDNTLIKTASCKTYPKGFPSHPAPAQMLGNEVNITLHWELLP